MKLLLNLISVKAGGQIVRAERFIVLVLREHPEIQLTVVKLPNILKHLRDDNNIQIINIELSKFFNVFHRLAWEYVSMKRLIARYNIDVFLSFSHFIPRRKFNIPIVLGLSNLAPFTQFSSKDESLFYRLKFLILKYSIVMSLHRADLIIALSRTARSVLLENNINPDKIIVAQIGVDQNNFITSNQGVNNIGSNVNKRFFLYVSHFYRYKNHKRLISAFSSLPSEYREKYQLVLVGSPVNLSYYKELKKIISNLKLEGKVILIDGLERKELIKYYHGCDLFVFPSLVENCPNSLLEAMSCGAPILTSAIAPMTEYCKDIALYFNPYQIESIKDGLLNFIESQNILEMKTASMLRSQEFSWENFTFQVINAIKNLK